MALFKATINIDQNYHPERLHKFFFINSPWLFQGLWAVVSPWLDPVTRSKVRRRCAPHTVRKNVCFVVYVCAHRGTQVYAPCV